MSDSKSEMVERATEAALAAKFDNGRRVGELLAPSVVEVIVRASIEAMGRPTPAMLKAALDYPGTNTTQAEQIWFYMLDAALKEST